MAAPIVFQTMAQKSTICPYNYSTYFMSKLHGKAIAEKVSYFISPPAPCLLSVFTCEREESAFTIVDEVSVGDCFASCWVIIANSTSATARSTRARNQSSARRIPS